MMTRTALDPVCEMEIRPEQAVAVARFEGHRVYFCSESCYAEFLDIPHRYVGWEEAKDGRRRHPLPHFGLRRMVVGRGRRRSVLRLAVRAARLGRPSRLRLHRAQT
jgi:YHS domain-containing protein